MAGEVMINHLALESCLNQATTMRTTKNMAMAHAGIIASNKSGCWVSAPVSPHR